jgi:hypothetical protein
MYNAAVSATDDAVYAEAASPLANNHYDAGVPNYTGTAVYALPEAVSPPANNHYDAGVPDYTGSAVYAVCGEAASLAVAPATNVSLPLPAVSAVVTNNQFDVGVPQRSGPVPAANNFYDAGVLTHTARIKGRPISAYTGFERDEEV